MFFLNIFSLVGLVLSENIFPQDIHIPVTGMSSLPFEREADINIAPNPVKRHDYLRTLLRSLMDIEDDIRAHQLLNMIKTSNRGLYLSLPEVSVCFTCIFYFYLLV